MHVNKVNGFTKIFVAATFLIMIVVNALANILPINGQETGQISDSYPNLFAPAGLTFAIWGVIYLFLTAYTLYTIGLFKGSGNTINVDLLKKIGIIFSISSLANAAWIFSWHYQLIPVSMILMLVILACLILINQRIKSVQLTGREKFFIRLPFNVYFGWITIATIANVTTLLVSLRWNGFGLSDSTWAIIIISVGMIIGLAAILRNSDIAYGIVLIWAYAGILIKHTSASGFSSQYSAVITTVIICMVLFVIAEAYVIFSKRKILNGKVHFKLT